MIVLGLHDTRLIPVIADNTMHMEQAISSMYGLGSETMAFGSDVDHTPANNVKQGRRWH